MNRTKIFKNFVKATKGKGPAKRPGEFCKLCLYFPDKHPGCSIGCQPGFREKFEDRMQDEETIKFWLNQDDQLALDIRQFFAVKT